MTTTELSTQLEQYFQKFRNNIIGIDQEFVSPFGKKKIIYTDWTASGRLYRPIEEKLMNAHNELSEQYAIVVYEGTVHPGVGSIVDLSYARVAKLLNAGVIMVVEGGIGSTIDMLNMNLSLFREENVPILGVIVNKVKPEKKEEIEHYLNIKLKQLNLKLLGVLPYEQSLSLPIMEAIRQAVEGRVVLNEEYMNNRIEDFIAGSLIDAEEFAATENLLLVTSIKRIGEAIKKIKTIEYWRVRGIWRN